ncbi:hypothetical protein DPMN_007488 [Dreissena polymorpha]|uniref:Condensin complex subunit 1 C-terminal domain-containing protein n=1 Tax=Dreissena polymorpha TaxID=45954 RepID=A0A9D4RWG7_DREPO|nr:hypothetical protein DPMN_007488 [Dreissena polymorpha]
MSQCRWGQVFILDSISNYTPKDDKEAQSICERVTPRLAHANAAVVLSAVKVSICERVTPRLAHANAAVVLLAVKVSICERVTPPHPNWNTPMLQWYSQLSR